MINNLMAYSVRNKFIVGVFILALISWGIYSLTQLPIDAVPDITNNQVQIITTSPNLATEEVEQFITTAVELSMQNLPGVEEIRSISRFGLSVVTVVFKESMGTYLPRQLVFEQLKEAEEHIPEGLGRPELAPITTGLGEIYQYTVRAAPGYEDRYSAMELRSIQDWIIKRQLSGIPGVIEVNTLGGFLKQYEVAINPEDLRAANITINEVLEALEKSNENTGGAYIEKNANSYFIRSEGMVNSLADIGKTVIKTRSGIPVLVEDVAEVRFGHAPRFGATTINGQGEAVGGIVLMLKGANSAQVTRLVQERIEQVQTSLPEGVIVDPFLVRNDLIQRAIQTVKTNLIEGGLIVIFILVLLLGNFRAGLIVASVIPLAMLFALGMMNVFGISANLMSLGAIDFGLIVDGAVIIVESIVHRLQVRNLGQTLTQTEMDEEVLTSSVRIRNSAAFGEIIILMVYIPILALVGIEGKMFRPMAMTVGFAILGALILSLTYVPMMSALFLNKTIKSKRTVADRIMAFFQRLYAPVLRIALRFKALIILAVLAVFGWSLWVFSTLGGEFIPTLEEGDLALHQILPPGSSLEKSVEISAMLQQKLLDSFPEVEKVVTKIGSAEVPTDPMPIETGDIMVILKPKKEWVSAKSKQELFAKMEKVMKDVPGISYEFSQPIQMRFNELMTGSRGDIAIKIYGEDLGTLFAKGKEAEALIRQLDGIASVKVEQVTGMPQIVIRYNYAKLAQYGLRVRDVNRVIRTAFAGETVGTVFERDRRFDLVVRLQPALRKNLSNIQELYIPLPNGQQVPLDEVATIKLEEAPMQISRDDTKRRIVISLNAGAKDTQTLVEEVRTLLSQNLDLPPGYYITYGGQFENFVKAKKRLAIAVPAALFLIFVLLFLTFGSVSQAALIFTAVPLSAIGGIWALWWRHMPFSISAGIGFIALFGVAVLNGIVLIAYFNQLEKEGISDIRQRIIQGTKVRLRPVILTAAVASFGFLPMALSNSGGAEVQRPLATVVIGGLITATVLTLIVLPILYSWLCHWGAKNRGVFAILALIIFGGIAAPNVTKAQSQTITLEEALGIVKQNSPGLKRSDLQIQQQQILQGSGFNLPKTTFFYAGDGLGRSGDFAEHTFGFQQSFQLPKAYKAQNEWQKANLGLVQQSRAVKELTVEKQVAMLYTNWLNLQANTNLLIEFDSLYSSFLNIAQLRRQTGEANGLEALAIKGKLENIQLLKQQSSETEEMYEMQLKLLLGIQNDLSATEDSQLKWRLEPNDTILQNHPVLGYYHQLQQVAVAKKQVEQTALLPGGNLRYGSQIFSGIGGLHGVQIGVNVPLFQKSQRKRIDAAALESDVAKAQLETQSLQLQNRQNSLLKQLESYALALQYFEEKGSPYAENLVQTAALSYRQGELGYLEYLQALEQALNLRSQYLENLRFYNQTVIEINYLLIP